MAWSNSKVFQRFLADTWLNLAAFDLDSDTFRVALYNNSITPDNDVSAALSAYNAGQWATANEKFQAGQWAQGGEALVSPTINTATADVVFWDAADRSSGTAFTVSDVYGCEIYDDTLTTPVADQGVAYIYFGGANGVTAGTLTARWADAGIFRATL